MPKHDKKTILKKNDTDNFEYLRNPECLEEHTTRNTTVNGEKKIEGKIVVRSWNGVMVEKLLRLV